MQISNGFTFNGTHNNEFSLTVKSKGRPFFAPISLNLIKVPGKKGAYFQRKDIDVLTIPIEVIIEGVDNQNYRNNLREIKSWLITEDENELWFDDDPLVSYLAILSDQTKLEELVSIGEGTIYFVCPDSDQIGPENIIVHPSLPSTIENRGTAKTFPKFTIDVQQDTTIISLFTAEKEIILGRPVSVDSEVAFEKYTKVFSDNLSTLTGWATGGPIDIGNVAGTFVTSGYSFYASDYGTGSQWHGPAIKAFKRLDEQLATLWNGQKEGPNSGAVAMYFVRLLRDIRARLPDIEAAKGFGLSAVPSLHEAVVRTVAISPMDEFATVALARRTVVGRSLWEGEPALPGSPSAGVFKFLRNLTTAMGDAGGDLWSPAAVGVLKRHLGEQICEAWLEALGSLDAFEKAETKVAETPAAEDGETGNEDVEKDEGEKPTEISEQQRDLLVQWLMDICYLGLFLGSDQESLAELKEKIYQKAGLETSAKARLAKAAQEYYKRTSLLFGLLT